MNKLQQHILSQICFVNGFLMGFFSGGGVCVCGGGEGKIYCNVTFIVSQIFIVMPIFYHFRTKL